MSLDRRRWNKQQSNDRFWAKVQKTRTCWLWTGAINNKGYGQVRRQNKTLLAHRVSYELHHGHEATGGLMHKCDVPLCVNPRHLTPGTQKDNMQDAANKKRIPTGEQRHNAKLTQQQVDMIKQDTRTQARIARVYKVTPSVVSRIKSNRAWATGSQGVQS